MCIVLICYIYGCCFKSAFLSLWWKSCCIYVYSSKYMVAVLNLFFFFFLHCTICLLLMILGWKLDYYGFAGRNLAFWYLAYLVIQLQDEESQVFTSLLLYSLLFIAYLLVIQFVFYQIITSLCFFNFEVSMWMLYFSSIFPISITTNSEFVIYVFAI